MSQVCELTGKRPSYGNKVSHSNIKSRTRWMPNLRAKKYEVPELKQTVSVLLSTRAIRTIDKLGGITQALMAAKEAALSERLLRIRNKIYGTRVKRTAAGKTAEGKAAKAAAPKHASNAAPKAKKAAKKK
jgi:large subunit ribosomal protein L28